MPGDGRTSPSPTGVTYHGELAVPEPHHPAGALGRTAPARHPPGDDAPGPPGEAAQLAPHQLANAKASAILRRDRDRGRQSPAGTRCPCPQGQQPRKPPRPRPALPSPRTRARRRLTWRCSCPRRRPPLAQAWWPRWARRGRWAAARRGDWPPPPSGALPAASPPPRSSRRSPSPSSPPGEGEGGGQSKVGVSRCGTAPQHLPRGPARGAAPSPEGTPRACAGAQRPDPQRPPARVTLSEPPGAPGTPQAGHPLSPGRCAELRWPGRAQRLSRA